MKCYLCSSKNNKKEFTVRGYQIFHCINCGLYFLWPQPPPDKFNNYYQLNYYDYQPNFIEVLYDKINKNILLSEIRKIKKKGRVLDVGCGNGKLLSWLKKEGWKTFGIDTSSEACQRARQELGEDKIFNQTLHQCKFETGFFDLILFSHVIEHLTDPLSELIEAKRIMKDSGILMIEIPLLGNTVVKLTKENYFAFDDTPGHLFHFTNSSFCSLLRKSGFKVYYHGLTLFEFPLSLIKGALATGDNKALKVILFFLSLVFTIPIKVLDWFSKTPEVARYYCQKINN